MAIGDGENDIEMLELASLGIALSNGSEKTKAVANLIGPSNDEDGVAEVIYRYAFWRQLLLKEAFGAVNYLWKDANFDVKYILILSFLMKQK